MADYTVKHLDDMEADFEADFGGGFVKVRAELGVTSFGVQVIRMPPDNSTYPEHDHSRDGQEEIYLALKGTGWIEIEGERVELGPDVFVRVGPGTSRKLASGPEGLEVLVIGATPGAAYEINPYTALTAS